MLRKLISHAKMFFVYVQVYFQIKNICILAQKNYQLYAKQSGVL